MLLAGCGEEEAGDELGARPSPGGAVPELALRKGPAADAPVIQLTQATAGSPAVIYFDSPTNPIVARSRKAFTASAAKGQGVAFIAVVLAEEEWPAPEGSTVFYADRTACDDAYGTASVPLIVAIDGEGVVRHAGGFMGTEEIVALARGLVATAAGGKAEAP